MRELVRIINILGWLGIHYLFIGIVLGLVFDFEYADYIVATGLALYMPDLILTIYNYLKCLVCKLGKHVR